MTGTSWMAKWGPLFAAPDVPGQAVPATGDEPEAIIPEEDDGGDPPDDPAGNPAEGSDPAAGAASDPAPGGDPAPAPVERTVPQRRADELVAERWAERRAKEAAEARAALAEEQLRQFQAVAAGQDPGAAPPARTPAPLNTEAQIAAGVAEAMFTQRCNEVANKGKEKHKDEFTTSLNALQTAAGGRLPREFAQVALDVGGEEGAADLILALGKDITKADEILRKTPIQQAVALTAMLAEVRKSPPARELSKTPAPVRPVVGSGGNRAADSGAPNTRMSMEDWMVAREKEVSAERKRGVKIR